METEVKKVESCLRKIFLSASDIYVDPMTKECEVKVSVDEYEGEIDHHIIEDKIKLKMVDFNDTFPYKYVFSYKPMV